MQFVINNWYLFAALVVILAMLFAGPIRQSLSGVGSVAIAQAVQLINRESGVIVDVREPAEYAAGHIPRALNIPLGALNDRLKELEKYKQRPVIVCCRSGQRAGQAAVALRKHGFISVHNLNGGLLAWEKENLPTETAVEKRRSAKGA